MSDARGTIRVGLIITAVAMVALAGVYALALLGTPTERFQGLSQKIFYLHAPAAAMSLTAFAVAGIASIGYLFLKDLRLDGFADASAEVGLALSAVMLTTGPMWGRPVWGTWWQWEPRLTLTLLLVLLFVGYRALRGSIEDPEQRARFAAVVAIMGLILVPFVHLSVYLFRTIHPQPVVFKPSRPSLPWVMLRTFLLSFATWTLLYIGLVVTRYGIGRRNAEAEA